MANSQTRNPPPMGSRRAAWAWVIAIAASGFACFSCGLVIIIHFWIMPKILTYERPVDAADDRFLQEFNAGTYEQICDEATPALQDAAQRSQLIELLRDVHASLGNATAEKGKGINFETTNAGSFVVTKYKVTFARGSANETIVWKRDGDELRLWAYKIDSSAITGSWGLSMWPKPAPH